jgi:8-oxo-dGTP diphosphatase
MKKTFSATVVLLQDDAGRVCLSPKKGNIHKGGQELENSQKWNGYGGKQEPGETILETAIRELEQESGVVGKEEDLELVARISFFWPGNETSEPDMVVYFFFLSSFKGMPKEGREMGVPVFFMPHEIPYHEMMPADRLFIPNLLAGEKLVWHVYLGKTTQDGNVYFEDKKISPAL